MSDTPTWDAWVWVKWKAGAPSDAWKHWDWDGTNIKQCWSTTGSWDCQLWVDLHSAQDLENFVWNNIRKNEWVESTETQWVKEQAGQFAT